VAATLCNIEHHHETGGNDVTWEYHWAAAEPECLSPGLPDEVRIAGDVAGPAGPGPLDDVAPASSRSASAAVDGSHMYLPSHFW
jgi:hypothetical protein